MTRYTMSARSQGKAFMQRIVGRLDDLNGAQAEGGAA